MLLLAYDNGPEDRAESRANLVLRVQCYRDKL